MRRSVQSLTSRCLTNESSSRPSVARLAKAFDFCSRLIRDVRHPRNDVSVIAYSDTIAGSLEELFDLTQDYARRPAWDPFPDSYEFHDGALAPAPGVELTVRARNGYSMRVKYVSYVRPRAAAIEMVSGPWFIRRFAGTWSFMAESANTTRVTFKYNVAAGPKWLSPVLQPLLNRSLSRHIKRRVIALKAYAESAAMVRVPNKTMEPTR